MVKKDFYFDSEEDAIIDMMFGGYDSQDEFDEAYGDMMNSLGDD